MRIGTKSFLGLSFKQVGLRFLFTLWRFRSTPSLSRLWISTTPSPSIPPSAPTASGENLLIHFMIFYVFLCLLCRSYGAKRPEIYKTSTTCFSSLLMRGLGRHMWGGISSSSWGKETLVYRAENDTQDLVIHAKSFKKNLCIHLKT